MSQLNLDLPPLPPEESSNKKSNSSPVNFIILIAAIAAAVGAWLPREHSSTPKNIEVKIDAAPIEGEFNQALLLKLKNAGAYRKAAEHLGLALTNKDLSAARKANLLKERGDFYLLDDNHQQALSDYYLAEVLLEGDDKSLELKRELSQSIIETLRLMGQYSAVSDELHRKNRQRQGESGAVKDPVVAKVDGVELKMSEFNTKIEKMIRQRIAALKAQGLEPAKEKEMTESIRQQYSAPFEQLKFLEQWVSQELLYQEALQWKLEQHPDYLNAIQDFRKAYLGQMLIRDKTSVDQISDLDLKNYAQANRDKLGITSSSANLTQADIDASKNKIVAAYKQDKSQELQQLFQAEMLKRHQVEIKREAFSEGAK